MVQRGRKSQREKETKLLVLEGPKSPEPPSSLSARERSIWERVVKAMPPTWFGPETFGLLTDYCRHEAASDRVAKALNNYEEGEDEYFCVEGWDKLLRIRERETRAKQSLARSLRISPSSLKSKNSAPPSRGEIKAPWEE